MVRKVTIGCLITVMFMLVGCGARDITQSDITASTNMETARGKCYDAVASQATADANMIKSVKEDDRTMLTMVYLNNKQTTELVAAATGNTIDRCAGSNLWDFLIAETEAKNKALTAGLGHAVTGVKWLAGAWAVTDIASQIGSTYRSEGMSSTYVNQEVESGNTATRNDNVNNTNTTAGGDQGI